MNKNNQDPVIKNLRTIGFIEGISALVLFFIAMPLKYWLNQPLAVKYVGWAHGLLFIIYLGAVAFAAIKYRWPLLMIVAAIAASVIPFGPFIFDARYLKKESRATLP